MKWNIDNIKFLYPPDDFVGSFTNDKMQKRLEDMQKQKIGALKEQLLKATTPMAAMKVLHKKDQMQFFRNNDLVFHEAKEFEQTLLLLFYRTNTPFNNSSNYSMWSSFFEKCDKNLLKNLGEEIPNGQVTAYRGSVTDQQIGLSWTLDSKQVSWFLDRWSDKSLGGGTIYSMLIEEEDILVRIKDDQKDEIIVNPQCLLGANIEKIDTI